MEKVATSWAVGTKFRKITAVYSRRSSNKKTKKKRKGFLFFFWKGATFAEVCPSPKNTRTTGECIERKGESRRSSVTSLLCVARQLCENSHLHECRRLERRRRRKKKKKLKFSAKFKNKKKKESNVKE